MRRLINSVYEESQLKKTPIPMRHLDLSSKVVLMNCETRDGNVSYLELIAISNLIAAASPKNLLEIGTFDGNTTLQMALNCGSDSLVHTIDLSEGSDCSIPQIDQKFVYDHKKKVKKFHGAASENKIIQHIGDSTMYDFNKFGPINFCFIDGGHSYACVKSDTEKTLACLIEGGVIVWHDFTPNWTGVYQYLCQLSKELHLLHIEGTHLVVYEKKSSQ